MTESEYRNILGYEIHDALIKSKAMAGKMIERAVLYTENDEDELDKDKRYAQLFDEISRIMCAFALEMNTNMR